MYKEEKLFSDVDLDRELRDITPSQSLFNDLNSSKPNNRSRISPAKRKARRKMAKKSRRKNRRMK